MADAQTVQPVQHARELEGKVLDEVRIEAKAITI